jgi:putative hydrolase of the HAD superfamily
VARGILFDVDFTLIRPGPMFGGEGYQAFCARYGILVDPSRFAGAVASAAALLEDADRTPYEDEIFVAYTRHIIEQMGGCGDRVDACAREIYAEWAECRHFELFEEVRPVLDRLAAAGVRIGLVSNSHRSLDAFQSHFDLGGLISAAVSSREHGFMKPHPSIFVEALRLLDVRPAEAVMVGDSVRHDVDGARRAGMRAILLHRGPDPHPEAEDLRARGVPVIASLGELPGLIIGLSGSWGVGQSGDWR